MHHLMDRSAARCREHGQSHKANARVFAVHIELATSVIESIWSGHNELHASRPQQGQLVIGHDSEV